MWLPVIVMGGGVFEAFVDGSVTDWTFSTDTPVCMLRASGRALEASPSQRGESVGSPPALLCALVNADIILYILPFRWFSCTCGMDGRERAWLCPVIGYKGTDFS